VLKAPGGLSTVVLRLYGKIAVEKGKTNALHV